MGCLPKASTPRRRRSSHRSYGMPYAECVQVTSQLPSCHWTPNFCLLYLSFISHFFIFNLIVHYGGYVVNLPRLPTLCRGFQSVLRNIRAAELQSVGRSDWGVDEETGGCDGCRTGEGRLGKHQSIPYRHVRRRNTRNQILLSCAYSTLLNTTLHYTTT